MIQCNNTSHTTIRARASTNSYAVICTNGRPYPARRSWETRVPLLIVGSEQWATPDMAGNLPCGGARQAAVLAAAAHRWGQPLSDGDAREVLPLPRIPAHLTCTQFGGQSPTSGPQPMCCCHSVLLP